MGDSYNVHCHVGSLENMVVAILLLMIVHCHVGSLENPFLFGNAGIQVHCHVGSLENEEHQIAMLG